MANEGGPNSAFWAGVRDLDNIIALILDIRDENEALLELLRQHAGPGWTRDALEKSYEIRNATRKAHDKLVSVHPRGIPFQSKYEKRRQ